MKPIKKRTKETVKLLKLNDMNIFIKKKLSIDKLILAKGRILIQKTQNTRVYKVLKVAKNVNYDSLGKEIQTGDLVISDEYLFNQVFKIGNDEYYIIKPSSIVGFFE